MALGRAGIDQEMLSDRLQAQHRGQQQQRRAGGPGLGTARGRVLDRVLGHRAWVAAEGFGEPTVEELRRLQDARGDLCRFLLNRNGAGPQAMKELSKGQIVPTW
jgi:hypothetical protein